MKNRKLTHALAGVLAAILLFTCTFAYFSDTATTQSKGTAGTVALSIDSDINLLDANGKDIPLRLIFDDSSCLLSCFNF